MRVTLVGGGGYIGGELLRLLVGHPQLTLAQVSSQTHRGRPVTVAHPNLRGFVESRFVAPEELEPCDAVVVAGGAADQTLEQARRLAPVVVDCGPDLRLRDPGHFRYWYGRDPGHPGLLSQAVYGLPEVSRDRLVGATLASGAGCSAVASILALLPVARSGWALTHPTCVEARFGSSAGGARPTAASHHPERAGAVRVFAPEGHRHQAEVAQALGWEAGDLSYSGVALEMVRGISVSARCFLAEPLTERQVWAAFRSTFEGQPFVRIVAQRQGLHRQPDPRWVVGTNFCDVGFALDRSGRRLTVLAALDNLGKGGAGNALQTLNLMLGLDECSGLRFPGLHPL